MLHRWTAWNRGSPAMLVVLLAVVVAACADPKHEPARQAIADVEQALADAGTEPAKYTPGNLSDVEEQVASLKQTFERGDFDGVLAAAPAVLAAARALPQEAAARKVELERQLQAEWSGLEVAIPAEIAATMARLDAASTRKTDRLPDEIIERGRQRLRDAETLWRRATEEKAAARWPEAVTLANQARERVAGVAAALGSS